MTRTRFALMGVVVGGIFLMAALAWAVTSNGPYYAMPAWDQKLPASTRFVVLLDWNSEAVLDRNTGLVWEKSPATTVLDRHFHRMASRVSGVLSFSWSAERPPGPAPRQPGRQGRGAWRTEQRG